MNRDDYGTLFEGFPFFGIILIVDFPIRDLLGFPDFFHLEIGGDVQL